MAAILSCAFQNHSHAFELAGNQSSHHGLAHIRRLAFALFWVPDDLSIQGETGSPVR